MIVFVSLFAIWLIFYFIPVGLWFSALVSGVRISLLQLILMRWRKVPPSTIVSSMIESTKAGLELNPNELEAHYLAGGNVTNVVHALVSAQKANIMLDFKMATAIDLAGRDVFEAVTSMLSAVEGTYALGILCTDTPDRLIAARKDAPLLLGYGEGENFIASDVTALLRHTRDVVYMDDGELAVVTAGSIRIYDERRRPVEKERHYIDWDVDAAEKGGYDHFMLKEINEQPAAITATVSPRVENGLPDLRVPELTDERLRRIGTVHLVGCGTAMHAGMVGKSAIEALARVPAEVDIASEFRYRDPLVDGNSLTIVISQSGATRDTLAALRAANRLGSRTLAVTNVVGSSIAREADQVVYTYAGPEIAVASTKAYSTQLLARLMLAIYVGRLRGSMCAER